MRLAHSNAFRGSAAFFAMLLAASASCAMDGANSENTPMDQTYPALPQDLADDASGVDAASKFTRRRVPLVARLSQAGLRA